MKGSGAGDGSMGRELKRMLLHGLAPLADRIWAQRGAILCLHAVRNERGPKSGFRPLSHLTVSPGFLEALISELQDRNIAVVPLAEAMARLQSRANGRFVSLTFDDGYVDNLTTALPVLRRLGAPCTIFLTSGFVDRTVSMWWVAFEAIIRQQDRICLPRRSIPAETPTEKAAAFVEIDKIARHLSPDSVSGFCREVFALNPAPAADEVGSAAVLSWDQARAMARTGLVTFGSHTVSHPILARLDSARCLAEIRGSRNRLLEELGVAPAFFAYPYGGAGEIGSIAPGLVAACEFKAAFTTSRQLLRPSSGAMGPYLVPRLVIESEDLLLTQTHISGLPWALRDARDRLLRRPGQPSAAAPL